SPRLDHRVLFLKEFTATIGGDVTLKISVIANPTPTFTWYKLSDGNNHSLGSDISSTTDVSAVGKLTLTNVQQGNIGTYQVVVSDGAKNTDLVKNLTLDVAGPPNIPSDVAAWSSDSNSISVAWIEAFNGGSEQTFIVQYREDTTLWWRNLTEIILENGRGTIQKAVISDLQSNMRYLVRVLAYNRYGYKDFTEEQEALTLPPGECLVPVSSNKVTGEGIAVGIGIGIVVAAAAVIVVIFILWRRGYVCASSKSALYLNSYTLNERNSVITTVWGDTTDPGKLMGKFLNQGWRPLQDGTDYELHHLRTKEDHSGLVVTHQRRDCYRQAILLRDMDSQTIHRILKAIFVISKVLQLDIGFLKVFLENVLNRFPELWSNSLSEVISCQDGHVGSGIAMLKDQTWTMSCHKGHTFLGEHLVAVRSSVEDATDVKLRTSFSRDSSPNCYTSASESVNFTDTTLSITFTTSSPNRLPAIGKSQCES
ncbi:uncharacterized protein LOC121391117, partial [Gigantopelta aegis]|uniref:uncharacterized protein LOC121391117 n=1 Tax=Gigantopelta aegis TaxID=1735272 RepID=UPI001B88E116